MIAIHVGMEKCDGDDLLQAPNNKQQTPDEVTENEEWGKGRLTTRIHRSVDQATRVRLG